MTELPFVTGLNDILPPAVGKEGSAALQPLTVPEFLKSAADRFPDEVWETTDAGTAL